MRRRFPRVLGRGFVAGVGLLATSGTAVRADGIEGVTRANWPTAWVWDPAIITGLFLSLALYLSGLRLLRQSTRSAHKARRERNAFLAGWAVLAIALISPVHPLGRQLFSLHMVQHELLMVVAAPLLVLGRPWRIWLWAVPSTLTRRPLRWWRGFDRSSVGRIVGLPFTAWLVHALALWVWHAPRLYEATLDRAPLHALQHACFFGSAVWFWQVVFFGPRRRAGYGMSIAFLFTTAMHTGALGALLTFATRPWYPRYASSAAAWSLTGAEDQQLGGVIMWVPAGLAYVIAALVLVAAWLRDAETSVLVPRES